MPTLVNTYKDGMNKDVSPLKFSNSMYYDMLNFKVLTDTGSSFGAIVNEKGNKLDFRIPSLQATYTYNINYAGVSFPTIIINGQSYTFTEDILTKTTSEIYNILVNVPQFQQDITDGNYNFYINGDNLVLIGLNELSIIDLNELFILNTSELNDLKIIGITNIYDSIVVFTTSNTELEPTSSDGQIWLINYNESINEVTNLNGEFLNPFYHLKYNGKLNFTTEKSITKALTRYETKNICRVYFTDYFNPLRSFNLYDPNGFAVIPDNFELTNSINFSKAVFTDISNGGNIPTGSSVQIGYRLIGGNKSSNISTLTNILPIYSEDDEFSSYQDIKGSPQSDTNNNKAVTFEIKNIDLSYQFIEFIYIIYEFNGNPIIQSQIEQIPSSGELTKTFTNNESDLVLLDLNAINTVIPDINIVKDITIKDNRLIAVNHKLKNFEITDNIFDARTYRFKSDGTGRIYQSNGTFLDLDNTFNVPEDHDAINTYNHINDPNYDNYRYQSDGVTLGGEGKYIKYKFITKNIIGDERGTAGSLPWSGLLNRTSYEDNFGTNTTHYVNNQFNNYTSPFVHNLYGGYQRGEVYRYGIVFKKKGQNSFVKWIGDIRFPSLRDTGYSLINDGDGTDINPLLLKILGIQFDITIPDQLKDKIDSYEIVRLKRTNSDKTRFGGGLLENLVPVSSTELKVNEESVIINPNQPTISDTNNNHFVGYISPLTLFSSSLSYKQGDYLKLDLGFIERNSQTVSVSPALVYTKFFNEQLYNTAFNVDIKNWKHVKTNDSISLLGLENTSGYATFSNKCSGTYIPTFADYSTGDTTLMILDNQIPSLINLPINYSVYATYCREVQNQYGGNTFESRSTNIYMSTSTYFNKNESSILDVFGGDTFINYFSYEHINDVDKATYSDKASSGIMFPCETPFNVELRHGNFFNKNRSVPDGTGTATDPYLNYGTEQFNINDVYLQENNISTTYISKNFISNTVTELPYDVWASEKKTNGELIDSWSNFLPNNKLEVDGNHGELNSIFNYKDKLIFYQDGAFGVIALNERAVVPDENGISLIIGNGQVLGEYAYISTSTGCKHRTGVVQTDNNIYHFDIRTKKIWKYSINSKLPLSDVKGMSSYLSDYLLNTPLEINDNPTSNNIPYNIHGVYDPRYNRIFYTILSSSNELQLVGDRPIIKSFTVSYNELLDTFVSFYSFEPKLYLNTNRKLLSINPLNDNSVYQHDKGNYGEFYDITYPSTIKYILSDNKHLSKTWNNLEWITEVTDTNNNDIYEETFDFIRVSNDYQDTNLTALQIPTNVNRRFRVWRHSILRNVDASGIKDRIRNPWTYVELRYNNTYHHRLVMNDLITHYKLQPINDYN